VTGVVRALAVVLVAALLQVVIVSSLTFGAGAPDLLLVVVVCLGLTRGSSFGAALGFVSGLVVDLVTLETLGLTSLVLTLAGFWAGRYAETTGRDRRLTPVVAVGAITVLAAVFGYLLHYLLGEEVVAGHALVSALVPTLIANLVLALPVFVLVRRLAGETEVAELAPEVEVRPA